MRIVSACVLTLTIASCDSGDTGSLSGDCELCNSAAAQSIQHDASLHSPLVAELPVVAQWNELALAGIRYTDNRPTVTAWRLFVLSVAMYDAVAVYTENSTPYALSSRLRRPVNEHTVENRRAAVSQAAYRALTRMFPAYERANGYFKQYLTQLGYQPVSGSGNNTEDGEIGYLAAEAAFLARSNDGSNSQNDFEPVISDRYPTLYVPGNSPDPVSETGIFGADFDPNRWQPLRVPNGTQLDENEQAVVDNLNINSFGDQEFLTPHWGAVQPFSLTDSAELRPAPPPLYGSDAPYTDAKGITSTNDEAYKRQIDEVLFFSSTLNDRTKVIAEFWADGPRTESPPGHWNQLTHGIIERDKLSIRDSVNLLFILNGALLDASIATWEAKRIYDYIRPASAIRWLYQGTLVNAWAGPNLGIQAIPGEEWRPYQSITFVTPPFPEYTSGHSAFSHAAAEVLTSFTGSPVFYDGITTTAQDINGDNEADKLGEHIVVAGSFSIEAGPAEDVILRWPSFKDAADEAGISRLYGGIHIQDADLRGRELGRQVGVSAYQKGLEYIEGAHEQYPDRIDRH